MKNIICSTKYFTIIYHSNDSEFRHCIVENIDGFYIELCNNFKISVSNRFDFKIIVSNSIDDHINHTGKTNEDYQSWMVGCFDLNKRKICIING
ncbi:hypothetical protein KQI42_14070 [Tissierella sp. MSJ-40]|uniref:Uncharacterized protein n=1 Tax=Tissierella simiarum TaxID=2841534 RepID=A0ABS6E8R2_9FIRM|nr:hypothetical protein [Tissierella simiarum]MBU5439144.1 hypothetical protein [Tissierella simiarum]